jgi:hypothetical protein
MAEIPTRTAESSKYSGDAGSAKSWQMAAVDAWTSRDGGKERAPASLKSDTQSTRPADGKRENTSGQLANSDARGHGSAGADNAQHTMAEGETLEVLARTTLGPKASTQEVQIYAKVVAVLNGITDPATLRPGAKIDIPGHRKDGTLTFTNPENKDEEGTVRRDGSIEIYNKANGTSVTRKPLDQYGSFEEHHKGHKPADNYDLTYTNKEHFTQITRKDADGKTVVTGSDGSKKTSDKNGNWIATYAPPSVVDRASYDKATGVTSEHHIDGSSIKSFDKDKRSEAIDADGTKTTKWHDGSVMVQKKDGQGHETGHVRHPDGKGGYKERAWGPQPKDNYDETYDPKSGTTTRVEGKGTAGEKQTTSLENGTVEVVSKDGKNYQRNPDGSEHHWGKENYDKPAYDYKNDERLNQAKEVLKKAVDGRIPPDKQADFQKDMTAFETRAQKDHLSPQEVAKTYEQMSRMLNASDDKAVVSGRDRALLAEGLMHQAADPDDTKQGSHNTCGVTTAAYETLMRNPSKAAEMAATTTLTGQWTASDGKVIKIDKQSLTPGAEEKVYPPADGERSYATQVLNLVMANDALQRRVPPESYVQRAPDRSNPDDTGERRLDASGQVINSMQFDSKTGTWNIAPDCSSPGVTDHELTEIGKRLNGESHVMDFESAEGGVESINSEKALGERLHQLKQQGKLPITIGVDNNHIPIQEVGEETPGYVGHFLSIDGYDEKTGSVHITNQWGKKSDKWVSLRDLYKNFSNYYASSQDGVDVDR